MYSPEKKETLFKHKVARDLATLDKCWFKKIQSVALRGIPDFLCCIGGHFVALELKPDDKTKPEPLQQYNLDNIKKAGGYSFKVTPSTWPGIFQELIKLSCTKSLLH